MQPIRLDAYLASQHRHYSRTQIKKLIDEGFVLVDGVRRKPSFMLSGGENIEMVRRAPEIPKAEAEEIPLDILYEDDDLLVINKDVGMVVHPAPGHFKGTLVSAVLHHLKIPPASLLQREEDAIPPLKKGGRGDFRPGIVHRLDKGTSGVMVVAKNDLAQRRLAQQFKDRQVEKTYLALVFGAFKQKGGTIDLAIGRDTVHRRKFSSKSRYVRNAVTHWETARHFGAVTLLRLNLETGRTHQIRVHLSESRHPIVGDTVYGAKSYLSSVKDDKALAVLEAVERPLLHAWKLAFAHPMKDEEMSFEAPVAPDMKEVLEFLEANHD